MDELQHAGVLGMKWGKRKAEPAASGTDRVTLQEQAVHIARREAGIVASRELLRKYGHQALPAAKVAAKGGVALVRASGRTLRGGRAVIRVLGTTVRLSSRFGKAYVKGAVSIAKAVR